MCLDVKGLVSLDNLIVDLWQDFDTEGKKIGIR